jgi:ABC-type transport system involved in cytochrome bd biosynthesis fused ATPase/permease subunit
MINEAELGKLTTYIEENLRASQNAGMGFIDPKHYKRKMHAKQNHVAYGRRGSGKSSLLSCLSNSNDHFNAYII